MRNHYRMRRRKDRLDWRTCPHETVLFPEGGIRYYRCADCGSEFDGYPHVS